MNDFEEPRPSDDLTRRLRNYLRSESAALPEPRGVAAAVGRASARRRHRRDALVAVVAVAVLATSGYVLTSGSDRSELATAPQQAVVDESLGFDWTVTDDGLNWTNQTAAGDSGLYALSTAPDTLEADFPDGAPRAMYRLGDDGRWEPILLEGEDPEVGAVSERSGTLYSLSTGTAADRHGRPTGSFSTDGGQSWSTVPLTEATPPSDTVAWGVSYRLEVASTAERTVALVSATISVPYLDLFPELDTEESTDLTWTLGDDGPTLARMDENGEPDEVVRTVTWAELGVSGPDDLATQRWAYVADGEEWTEARLPEPPPAPLGAATTLQATRDAFLYRADVFTEGGEESTVHRSVDGQTWEPLTLPGSGELLAVDEGFVFLDMTEGRSLDLRVSRDGADWQALDLRTLDPRLDVLSETAWINASAGPLGLALVVGDATAEGLPLLLFSPDLTRWSVTDLSTVAPEGTNTTDVIVGADRIVVLGARNVGEKGSPERTATLTGVPRDG